MRTASAQIIVASLSMALGAVVGLSAQRPSLRHPATPLDAITTIIDAYRSYQVVALGEGPHGNEQGHAFRLALIHDPRFIDTVNDIVVECGNGHHQEVIDRFIRGDSVPEEEFRHVLLNSSYETAVCERPIYGDFYRAIRAVNQTVAADHQLRVLFGGPPVNWETTLTRADFLKEVCGGGEVCAGDRFVFDLIRHEVIATGRHALVVYGDGHFQARSERPPRSLLARLDHARIRTLAISNAFADFVSIQPDVASWPIPSLAMIRGTPIGAKPFSFFYGATPPGAKWPVPLEAHFDAMLYLGPRSSMTISGSSPELCRDAAYMRERIRRLAFMPNGHGREMIDSLKMYCAAQQD